MTAAPGAKHFGTVFFESNVPRNGGHFLAHNVGGAEAGEGLPDGYLSDALLRGVQNEPADQDGPEHLCIAVNHLPHAPKNHRISDQLSAGACDTRGFLEIPGGSPDHRSENSASVEWKSRQEIENGEREIGPTEPSGKSSNRLAVGEKMC